MAYSEELMLDEPVIGEVTKDNCAVADVVADDNCMAENRIVRASSEKISGTVFQHTKCHSSFVIHHPYSISAILLVQTEEQFNNCICCE